MTATHARAVIKRTCTNREQVQDGIKTPVVFLKNMDTIAHVDELSQGVGLLSGHLVG